MGTGARCQSPSFVPNVTKRDGVCEGPRARAVGAGLVAILQLSARSGWYIRTDRPGSRPQSKGSTELKISARNQIKGTVKSIREGAVNAVVVICRGNHNGLKADITMESVKDLGLEEGKECYAVIKATNVMFAASKIEGISARNQIEGKVVKVEEGAVNGHVTIEDVDGVRICGSITNEAIESLGLAEGKTAVAIVKATDVMVAVD